MQVTAPYHIAVRRVARGGREESIREELKSIRIQLPIDFTKRWKKKLDPGAN